MIIEIGGNDLFSETEAAVFRKRLEELVSSLKEQDHALSMFELPLLPFHNEYGIAQREIASKYQVTLIPKWVLTTVLGMEKGTIDGLHLSEAGHQRLAQSLWKILQN